MSKSGYGSPREIEEWDAETVLGLIDYESFTSEYEQVFLELNKAT